MCLSTFSRPRLSLNKLLGFTGTICFLHTYWNQQRVVLSVLGRLFSRYAQTDHIPNNAPYQRRKYQISSRLFEVFYKLCGTVLDWTHRKENVSHIHHFRLIREDWQESPICASIVESLDLSNPVCMHNLLCAWNAHFSVPLLLVGKSSKEVEAHLTHNNV